MNSTYARMRTQTRERAFVSVYVVMCNQAIRDPGHGEDACVMVYVCARARVRVCARALRVYVWPYLNC